MNGQVGVPHGGVVAQQHRHDAPPEVIITGEANLMSWHTVAAHAEATGGTTAIPSTVAAATSWPLLFLLLPLGGLLLHLASRA